MHKFLMKRYAEKTALWGTLTVLNAPLGFLPLAITGLSRLHSLTQSHDALAEETTQEVGYRAHPENGTLSDIAKDMGKQAGVTIKHVFVRSMGRFRNAEVIGESRKETSMIFEGNPLNDPVLNETEQGEAVMRGVIAHELGHALSNGDNTFRNNAFITGVCYCMAGSVGIIAGICTIATGGLAAGAAMLGGAVLSGATGFLTMALNQRFSRNEEYLADLRGAEIFGADNMVICHDYNLKVLMPERNADPLQTPDNISAKGEPLGARFIAACLDFYGDDHPEPQDRIDALRHVFGTTASFTPIAKNLEKPHVNPSSGGVSCTHS